MADEPDGGAVEFRAVEPRRTPALELVLGHGATVPFALGAAAAWLFDPDLATLAERLTVVWGGAVLAFFSGVRRGLSFRNPGGETAAQVAASLWLFALGFAALAVPWPVAALALLLAGYLSVAALDPWAARRGEAPPFFARLRPVQMAVPVASLAALLVLSVARR
jgi:hypothetical protein